MAVGTLGRPGWWCGLGSMLSCPAVLGRHGWAEKTTSRGAATACADPPVAHGSSCRQVPHSVLRLARLFLAALLGVCCNNHMTSSSTRCCWHDPHAAKHASAAEHSSVFMAQPAPSHICGGLWPATATGASDSASPASCTCCPTLTASQPQLLYFTGSRALPHQHLLAPTTA